MSWLFSQKIPIGAEATKKNGTFINNMSNTATQVYQCKHCDQHYLRKASYEKHVKSCKKSPECKSKCFRCSFLLTDQVPVYTGEKIKKVKAYFCDRMGNAVHEQRTHPQDQQSILMPTNCLLFQGK